MTAESPDNFKSRAHDLIVLLCVSIPSFMTNLDSNIVAVSLPYISKSLRTDFAGMEWVVSAYTLMFASFVLPAGAIADRYGRKRLLLAGLITFTTASLICGAAPNLMVLIAARAIQGVGAAMQLSAALATLSHAFQGAARARAFAVWGSIIGIAISLGPVIGGIVTQTMGWRVAFYLNVPIGFALFLSTIGAVKESKGPVASGIDVPGALTFSGSLFMVTLALIGGNQTGWSSPRIICELLAACMLFCGFIAVERGQKMPMLELRFFRHPTYVGANLANVAFAASSLTMLTYLPIFLQAALGLTAEQAGLRMLPMAIPLFVVPRICARVLANHLSGRSMITLGLGLISVGTLWMALEVRQFNYLHLAAGMLTTGAGAGVLNGEIAKVGMTVIPVERAGMAAGLSGTTKFSGIVIGFAALGAVLSGSIKHSLSPYLANNPSVNHAHVIRLVAAGGFADASSAAPSSLALRAVALQSFGAGYQVMMLTAAALATLSALLCWYLIRQPQTIVSPHANATTPKPVRS
jgi:EmrB/QacA subfamily drug resistance transporter